MSAAHQSATPGGLFWKPAFYCESQIYIYQQSWNVKGITRSLESTGGSLIWSCKPHLHMPFRNGFKSVPWFFGCLWFFSTILIQVGGDVSSSPESERFSEIFLLKLREATCIFLYEWYRRTFSVSGQIVNVSGFINCTLSQVLNSIIVAQRQPQTIQ